MTQEQGGGACRPAGEIFADEMQKWFEQKEFENIVSACQQAMENGENTAEAYFWLGVVTGEEGNIEKAVDFYTKAIESSPQANYYAYRGSTYAIAGLMPEAIADYSQAIRIKPEDWLNYANRGVLYMEKEMYEHAVNDFNEALELEPKDIGSYYNRGEAFMAQGLYSIAIDDFNAIIALAPEDADAYAKRGQAYSELGMPDKAIADYDKSIELDPENISTVVIRASLYMAAGRHDDAIAGFTRAVEANPEDARACFFRGIAYVSKGDFALAVNDFDQMILAEPEFAITHYNKALCCDRLQRPVEAAAAYRRFLELAEPGSFEVKHATERLKTLEEQQPLQ
ncbi:MAG TPA: tetratricopeptide repeat protein [Patescibacteria group bacterium]|nr:tetratricopeptide repeat protein [Patescibacteria group bacterium]